MMILRFSLIANLTDPTSVLLKVDDFLLVDAGGSDKPASLI
jgi:hypothetical protein